MVRPLPIPSFSGRAETRTRWIFRALALKIFSGEWRAGDHLPPERDLALEFGVSRATLREALKQLISYGLISAHQGIGTVVKDWRADAGMELLPLYLEVGAPGLEIPRLVPTILRLRCVLLEEIITWLCAYSPQEWTKEAEAHLKSAWESRRNPIEFVSRDYQFVRYLCGASGFFPALWVLNELQGIYLHFVHHLPQPPPVPRNYYKTWVKVLGLCQKGFPEKAKKVLSRYFEELDRTLLRLWGLQ